MEEVTMGLIPSSMRVPLDVRENLQSLPVRGRDGTKPVERIRRSGVGNTVERNLTANQVNKEGNDGPKAALTERNLLMSQKGSNKPSFQGS